MELLRFSTAGSVDDGKSTLIGRLLYDSKSIFEDQLEAVEAASRSRGNEAVNLALLTDGLRAEREQGITIDVAYRYFATPRRKFIIADTPGHVQYTRNMVTGASTADLSIILIDARHGVLEQTVRHSYLSSLLDIQTIVVAINKMDLVNFSQERFLSICNDYRQMAATLNIGNIEFIPICATDGDNVVNRSNRMPWYQGKPLLEFLETVPNHHTNPHSPFRYPVQYVIRPIGSNHHDFRGYAGRVASGTIRPGDKVTVFPSGLESSVTKLWQTKEQLTEAAAGLSITIELADDIDISRGDMLVKTNEPQPLSGNNAVMNVCWFNNTPLRPRNRYLLRQATSETLAIVRNIRFRRNINTLEQENVTEIRMNDIAQVEIHTANTLICDRYKDNHTTGSAVFIDIDTNETVGAGMIESIN